MKLSELNLHEVGNTIQLVGVVYDDPERHRTILIPFPDEPVDESTEVLEMGREDWEKFLRQTDTMETEILQRASDGKITKAIVRKCQRQIDQKVAWTCYERDEYKCRYCGAKLPLTVDHLVRWEEGGPTTVDNLLSACKKCNRTRGDKPYAEWLQHPYYKKVSRNLDPKWVEANERVAATLDAIPRVVHKRSR